MIDKTITYSLENISNISELLIEGIKHGVIILLSGDPGVGKSTLIYSLIKIIEKETYLTQSPTFSKINEYPQVIHMDWYYGNNIYCYQDYLDWKKFIFIEWGVSLKEEIHWNFHWHIDKINETTRQITIYKNLNQ